MILSDCDIKHKVATGEITIEPFDANCLQPASYDLHLDNHFKLFKTHLFEAIDSRQPVTGMMEDLFIKDGGVFVLHPGAFALGLLVEKTGVNNKHVGRLEGKSSLARMGLLIHTTAGFLDPGNSTKLTLELFNASPLPIKLYPGMKVAQIAFEEISSACEKPYHPKYGNKYYDAKQVQESLNYLNYSDSKDKK